MIRVQREDFDPAAEVDRLTERHGGAGAVVTFTGLVREFDGNARLTAMTLEHYPGMTEKALEAIDTEARSRFDLLDTLIVHRYGRLEPGERIVLVVTVSAHRADAFQAAEFLMDWLKTKAPFWKREETAEGPRWVAARTQDEEAAGRWRSAGPSSGKPDS